MGTNSDDILKSMREVYSQILDKDLSDLDDTELVSRLLDHVATCESRIWLLEMAIENELNLEQTKKWLKQAEDILDQDTFSEDLLISTMTQLKGME